MNVFADIKTYSKIFNLPASGTWVVAMVAAVIGLWAKREKYRLAFVSLGTIIVRLIHSPGGLDGMGGSPVGQSMEKLMSK